ncbi:hypothetical protein J437_LFUL010105 [Ladona fulva]|uniref:G-protein coupled receptors family 1 profile domain-containing protein n=1 Tax=Ladona fulva TaxID=123851 RepID=A0A8K0K9Z1_LADFU|nr:hypothetical protein J437_LFUL010105 [Ladona fulva]
MFALRGFAIAFLCVLVAYSSDNQAVHSFGYIPFYRPHFQHNYQHHNVNQVSLTKGATLNHISLRSASAENTAKMSVNLSAVTEPTSGKTRGDLEGSVALETTTAAGPTSTAAPSPAGFEGGLIVPLYVLIFVLSVGGNCLVLATLAQNKRMRTVTNVFLLNLVS